MKSWLGQLKMALKEGLKGPFYLLYGGKKTARVWLFLGGGKQDE
jgi:hypothetical protein